jgi:hypothetical protein
MNDKLFTMRLPSELLDRIDVWRLKQPTWPSLAAAMRVLIERGLAESLDLPRAPD